MKRISREEWLLAGSDILVESGAPGLTVSRLCERTKKTKGSFYHHFQGRDDFCQALLEYWEKTHTEELIQLTQGQSSEAALEELHRLAQALPPERETAFRSWSLVSQAAAEVVKRVDEARVQYLASLYLKAGNSPERSQSIAWLEYCLFLGAAQLRDTFKVEDRKSIRNLVLSLEDKDES